jgi:gliding motility-associated-like protein
MTNYREYIEVPLISRLESDTCYHVLMHVNLANTRRLSSKNIGAYFSDTLITGINNYYPLPFTPQFNNTTSALPDTLNWTLVEGEFIAGGDERYMIIGNFNNDSLTNAIWINNAGWLSQVYLYIDDVSVYKCKTPIYSANAGVDTTICLGDSVVLEMQHYNNYQYRWYTMNGVLINTNNSLIVSPDTTTSYILKVTDFKYDVTVDTITVIVDDCSNPDTTTSIETLSIVRPQVYISNVFSPNNDGLNDMFEVKGKEIESLHLLIYNLWGNLIFESNDISRGWDGMQNGKKCEAGVYVYRVEIRFNNGQEMNRNGTLTLVR